MNQEALLNEEWTADVVGRLHRLRITCESFATECNYNPRYLSAVLNGKKAFSSEEAKNTTKERIYAALDRLERNIMGGEGNA